MKIQKIPTEFQVINSQSTNPCCFKATEFKANFDVAWFNESDEAGIGVVVRDSAGQVIAGLVEKIKKKTSLHGLFGDDGSKKSSGFCTRDWLTKMPIRG